MRPYHWLYHWLYWLCTWQDMSASSAGRESRAQLTLLLFVRWCSNNNIIIATKDDIVHLHFYQTKTDQGEFGNKILLDILQMIQRTGWNIFLRLKWFPDIVKHKETGHFFRCLNKMTFHHKNTGIGSIALPVGASHDPVRNMVSLTQRESVFVVH